MVKWRPGKLLFNSIRFLLMLVNWCAFGQPALLSGRKCARYSVLTEYY